MRELYYIYFIHIIYDLYICYNTRSISFEMYNEKKCDHRDTAKYPPLMQTNKLSNSLKYLAKTYLG